MAMKQAGLRLLVVAGLTALTTTAYAQKGKKPDPKAAKPPAGEVEDLGGEDTPPPPKEEPKEEPKGAGAAAGGEGGASFICEANPEACQTDKLIRDYSE